MVSQEAIQKILGISEKVHLTTLQMAKRLKVSFSPNHKKASKSVSQFSKKLEATLIELGVQIIPFDLVWERVSYQKRIKRFIKHLVNNIVWLLRKVFRYSEINYLLPFKTILQLSGARKIKEGICVICIGEQDTDELSMQYISNFKTNSIITILDFPEDINESSSFTHHFNASMSLFAYHMTNIVIAVNQTQWMVYNFNASHPIYPINDSKFNSHVLKSIIPKIVAPISPHKFSEFVVRNNRFNIRDNAHKFAIKEMLEGGKLFERTHLFPDGKEIDDLPFRHPLHRLIGKMHLDNRNGMSFGFIAFQMPVRLGSVKSCKDFKNDYPNAFSESDYFTSKSGRSFLLININDKELVLEIPEVWVMTLRSGANKTQFNPDTDILKLGLNNGKMYMQFPECLEISRSYKPSFDTKVILAHAIGNALLAEVSEYFAINEEYTRVIKNYGYAISHWHGYFNHTALPKGLAVYGGDNPHVSCSSPQSAIYALHGKINAFIENINSNDNYNGDIHIEPHHGINISYPRLTSLAQYILDNPTATALGNKYL